jgi:hypothetical protein
MEDRERKCEGATVEPIRIEGVKSPRDRQTCVRWIVRLEKEFDLASYHYVRETYSIVLDDRKDLEFRLNDCFRRYDTGGWITAVERLVEEEPDDFGESFSVRDLVVRLGGCPDLLAIVKSFRERLEVLQSTVDAVYSKG